MYELCNVKNNTYYINCPAKIGLYIDGADAYLIDSGNDKDAGKKVKRILDENGWSLKKLPIFVKYPPCGNTCGTISTTLSPETGFRTTDWRFRSR